eukprot:254751_1
MESKQRIFIDTYSKTVKNNMESTVNKEHTHVTLNQNEIISAAENSGIKKKIYKTLDENVNEIVASSFLAIVEESKYDNEDILDDFDEDVESYIISIMIERNKNLNKNHISNIIGEVIKANPSIKPLENKQTDITDKDGTHDQHMYGMESRISIVLKNKYDFHIAETFKDI